MGISRNWPEWLSGNMGDHLWNAIKQNWYLGFTSFGGPPVHFKIFHDLFVQKRQWISEEVYQELFSVCQAFSGPGSTKMHYCINLIHDGVISAIVAFLIWSLPGALGMYGLSIGVANIGQNLPTAVYALLSGLNSATVGIIALAAVELAEKAITDRLTRILVFLGAAAGMLYNSLWYFPLLMLIAGVVTVIFDYRWLHRPFRAIRDIVLLKEIRGVGDHRASSEEEGNSTQAPAAGVTTAEETESRSIHRGESNYDTMRSTAAKDDDSSPPTIPVEGTSSMLRRIPSTGHEGTELQLDTIPRTDSAAAEEPHIIPVGRRLNMSWKSGLAIIAAFIASFIAIMVLRGVVATKPLLYHLFANMYLAGTIIFGGGPVVIPLLRNYVVDEGWVSPRDFLIGLALIQGFPGPNFNFAVYLGGLTAIKGGFNPAAGAVLGYLGIFVPGLVTVHGTMGIWSALRGLRWVRSALRGVNAAAVGLIFTAVYRLWQIGWIDADFQQGTSLANDPWWVVVTATSYVGGCWFGLSPPAAIVLGAIMGLIRYGVVSV